jgi:hypothetical protein
MPATTTCAKLPYPVDADPIDVTGDMRRLAQAVDAAICGANTVGLGIIQAWWDNGGSPPAGTLRCDGSSFDPAVYPDLASHLGASVTPDLRGRFLRGRDAVGGPFPNNAQRGGFADSQLPTHHHGLPTHQHAVDHDHPAVGVGGGDHAHVMTHGHPDALTSANGDHAHGYGFSLLDNGPYNDGNVGGFHGGNVGVPLSGSTYGAGAHQHVSYTPTHSGWTSDQSHSHTVDIPHYSGVSGFNAASTSDNAGGEAANRNLPPFQNVTFVIQATKPVG